MTAESFSRPRDLRTRRIGRVWLAGLALVACAAFVLPNAAQAADADSGVAATEDPAADYVPTTTTGTRSIRFTALAPECIADAPYIQYTITPTGFSASGPATLSFYDLNGVFIESRTVPSLSGITIYTGASVDPPDWPGWKQAENGNWIPDPTDASWRDGLTVRATLGVSADHPQGFAFAEQATTLEATGTVSYPPASSPCFGPPEGIPPATTVCVGTPGPTGGSSATTTDPCQPCVPATSTGGGSSATPTTVDPNCSLPRTGSDGTRTLLMVGGATLAAGALITLLARRRRTGPAPV